jgi:hypothetical protein
MERILPRMRETFLGGHRAEAPAHPVQGPAAGVSSLMPKVPEPIGPGARHRRLAEVCLVRRRLTLLGISLVALPWALILGLASIAGNLAAREEASPPDGPGRTASTVRVQPGSPVRIPRLGGGSTLRSHKRSTAVPKIVPPYNPNGDKTSDDPDNDDDAWDEPNDSDDTDVPIIAWFQEMVPSLFGPEPAPVTWTAPTSPPFLKRQRLRC